MQHPADRQAETGARPAATWPRIAVLGSALLIGTAAPCRANDVGSFFGGVVGQIIGQSMQRPQPYYPAPQYYQQPQYQQPQYHQRHYSSTKTHQAEQKPQKAKPDEKKDQEQASAQPAVGDGSGPVDVPMKRKNGNLWVPAQINKVVTIDFVIDSGASDITLPRDVYMTLIRSGTLTKANYLGTAQFGIADGSEVKGAKFKLASLQVGNQTLTDVVASVMPSDSATPLLGLSFLSRFQSWSIDNNSGTLKLVPLNAGNPPTGGAPTQTASATRQPLPELPAGEPGTQQSAAQPQVAAAQTPTEPATGARPAPQILAATTTTLTQAPSAEPKIATAASEAPRSGHVASSALIASQTTTPAEAAAAAQPETKPVVPVFPAHTSYATARSSLLALGYGPASLPDAGKCDSNTDSTCFPERAMCAKGDSIQCEFLWRRGEQVIKVTTVAVPPTVAAIECQVNCK